MGTICKKSKTFYNLIWIFQDVNIKVIYQNCTIKRHTLYCNAKYKGKRNGK